MYRHPFAVGAALMLALAACSSDTQPETVTSTVTTQADVSDESAPLSEEATLVLGALDELGAEYTEPEENDSPPSDIEAAYDLDIDGYASEITTFVSVDDLNAWLETPDFLSGVSVTFGATAVVLDSDEGRDASVALAQPLAEELDGIAHIGGDPLAAESFAPSVEQNPAPAHDGVPIADGGTCPAYLCGYGHDEQGNPNPTPGELQTQHGCEQGYITDPELCAAVGTPNP